MASSRARLAGRALVVAGLAALVAGAPVVPAQAATEYDGEATALRIEGLRLQLFPHGPEGAPKEFAPLVDAFEEIRSHGPAELQRDSLSLAMPDQTIGHAQYPGSDTKGDIPDNPLITADVVEARSVDARKGGMVSEASVAGLSLGGGVLSADVIRCSCAGTGDNVTLDVSHVDLNSNQQIVESRVELEPGTAVPIRGLASMTFNQRDTDGTTYGEATSLVIDLDTDLSMAALGRLLADTAPAMEDAVTQVIANLSQTRFGGGHPPFKDLGANADRLHGERLWAELDKAVAQTTGPAGAQASPGVQDALNNVAHLDGTITIANAACAQQTVTQMAAQPQQAVPARPVSDREPPLADTGSPAGMVGIGLAGIAALVGGGLVLTRLRGARG